MGYRRALAGGVKYKGWLQRAVDGDAPWHEQSQEPAAAPVGLEHHIHPPSAASTGAAEAAAAVAAA